MYVDHEIHGFPDSCPKILQASHKPIWRVFIEGGLDATRRIAKPLGTLSGCLQ